VKDWSELIGDSMMTAESITNLDQHGFIIVDGVLNHETVRGLLDGFHRVAPSATVSQREQIYAIRHLLEAVPAIRELARCESVRCLVASALGAGAFPVQGIYFDKPPGANWKVPWHQDLTIPVRARGEAPGFGPWSVKGGVPHVQAPAWLLERMLIVRLHLDECTVENGALRVIAGSHRHGRLSSAGIERLRERSEEVICEVPRGGALVMRPLLLHASSVARVPGHRRVIHLEYAADPLPDDLAWYRGPPSPVEGV
jgi:Phytanoyl-CoA dioxygenase (PhyH)